MVVVKRSLRGFLLLYWWRRSSRFPALAAYGGEQNSRRRLATVHRFAATPLDLARGRRGAQLVKGYGTRTSLARAFDTLMGLFPALAQRPTAPRSSQACARPRTRTTPRGAQRGDRDMWRRGGLIPQQPPGSHVASGGKKKIAASTSTPNTMYGTLAA